MTLNEKVFKFKDLTSGLEELLNFDQIIKKIKHYCDLEIQHLSDLNDKKKK